MKKKILLSMMLLLTGATHAKSLELRPLLKDRFEQNCAIRQQYDFHNENSELIAPLEHYTIDVKYVDKQVYDSTTYKLKNVTYAGIPIRKIEFSFGRPAQQYNQYLYFDLSATTVKQRFKTLKFNQNHEKGDVSVEYKNNTAIVQCYWLADFSK